ncbi:MlaA family lipoprotein [Thalassotalea euphylliae]|uniref:VacJ family lipoprotein n=1 Tax=Thalassotalea euphylliae TaxID=1655234 RepID=A0A3E0U4W4_9GAMM|nr:VacJ family lipoprotein [Thalassotalea euphylliae]REL31770.1 VacJ family lipoprotein [Thalassotalea euphylliae]
MKLKTLNFQHIALALITLLLSACSAKPQLAENTEPPRVKIADDIKQHSLFERYADPFEGFNRRMYYFNAKADEYVLLPIVSGYKTITPDPVEKGVSNFFSNLGELPTLANALLQLKFDVAATSFARFALNSTIGLVGLFDVASPIGLKEQNEDFGQTLGYWGVGSGPYLVLPLLGPSSMRDATGLAVDTLGYRELVKELDLTSEEELFLDALRSVNGRANVPFKYYQTGSAFEYERIKLLYMKFREIQIKR